MKKNSPFLYFLCSCLFLLSFPAKAQYVIKEADHQYNLFNYHKAIDLYEQAYKKKASLHAAERLGYAYSFLNDYKQAESWYATAIKMPGSKMENILGYAKALQSNSKYTEAKVQYLNYISKNKEVTGNQQYVWLTSCDSALKWMKNPKQVELINQKVLNTAQSEWGAVDYQGAVVFTSDRVNKDLRLERTPAFFKFDGANLPDKKVSGQTGNNYLRLYIKSANKDSISLFPIRTETNYHTGTASFTADGNTMYFTLTRIQDNFKKSDKNIDVIHLGLFSSIKDPDGTWGEPVPFIYNKINEYSIGDPFISADGQSLYFASDMPGGKGGSDLYVCLKSKSGGWGKPQNLAEVNSEGNERSPFFDSNNNLYFSSDGRVGMGGLDVYRAIREGKGIGRIENMGYPFNSAQDDFGFSLSKKNGIAYLSSNRDGGLGSDDIYSVDQEAILAFRLTGHVFDKKNNKPLSHALVTLAKVSGGTLKIETDQNGIFKFNLNKETEYNIFTEKTGYTSTIEHLATVGLNTSSVITQNLFMDTVEIDKAIRLENIYYDFNRSEIRKDATIELDKLVQIMVNNPTIWIELGSHTDCRGKDSHNLLLSQKRADSAVHYILSKGIAKNRISAKGYGAGQLLNKCTKGISCTEKVHQLNRRTEFKIVKQ